ncbi:MAG: c-type cytochrome biogenesis protein CcsB [Deltaproteobacteria bacterium]|nr:c-type cytochrome biogenesis protein CcsB [Deltaproteobacteria bacterium]
MNITFFYITATLYLSATFITTAYLIVHNDKIIAVANKTILAGFVFHTLTILSRWVEAGRPPFANLHEVLSLFSWMVVAIYLLIHLRHRLAVLGAFVAPFALLLLVTASFLPKEIVPLAPSLMSYWLPIHVAFAFLGNAFFAMTFLFGVMYLIQERYLKSKRVGGLYFLLPSLDILDDLGYKCLTFGFPLLTMAIFTGAIWAEYVWGSYWTWEPRQTWSLITWFLYAALLHGRLTVGWRGRRAAIYSIVSFLILIGSFIIIKLFSWGAHAVFK